MKIAHVCPFYFPAIGGVRQVVEELAKRQIKQGHEVHVFTSDWDKNKRIKKKEEIIEGIHVHRCFHIAKIANFATIWPSVFIKLLKEKPDIIHSHLFGHIHFILSALSSKFMKIPHIHTTHCPWSDAYRSSLGKIGIFLSYNFFSRLAFKFTNKIIAITPWEVNFIKKFGGRESQIIVIPNGMDAAFFKKIKKNNFKKSNKINGKLVLFFGRLNNVKGPDKFVEIAKLILKERKDIFFVIRGPDEGMKEKVKKLIGNEKRILLLSETRDRKEIIKMYQSADLFVLPSYREGLPLTLFEAMASELSVVASPVNGVPYEIKEPENGFLVKYGDNKKFKQRILELLDNSKLNNKIKKNNRKISEDYKWDTITKRTLNLYDEEIKKTKDDKHNYNLL
jgi:glycosyltransferase involved in cell wall biosynthesis